MVTVTIIIAWENIVPNMENNEDVKANFTLKTPKFNNFGFDVIDKRANESDKLAYIEVNGSSKKLHITNSAICTMISTNLRTV